MNTAEYARVGIILGENGIPYLQALGLVTAFDLINYQCPIVGFNATQTKTYGLDKFMPTCHWSRTIEYPWCMVKAELTNEMEVCDVGAGNNPFQLGLAFICKDVVNIDLDVEKLKLADELPCRGLFPNLRLLHQDVMTIPVRPTGWFDRVFCISVMEHMPDPVAAARHLYSLVKPGGRLLFTFDVTDSPCPDFPISFLQAQRILAEFGLEMPSMEGALTHTIQANDRPRLLWVMMVAVDRPVVEPLSKQDLDELAENSPPSGWLDVGGEG